MSDFDRIEKTIVLRASRARVWRAISDAERHLGFRWHPYAVDPAMDYSAEPTTLVEFTLDDAPGATPATRVTIVESGFDRIPLARRAEAVRMNEGGWTAQIVNLERHVAS